MSSKTMVYPCGRNYGNPCELIQTDLMAVYEENAKLKAALLDAAGLLDSHLFMNAEGVLSCEKAAELRKIAEGEE